MCSMRVAGSRREWTATVNGTGLRVEEIGTGAETVVFSPAMLTNRELFEAPVAALSDSFRCIAYDHRGQGDSGFGARQPAPGLLGTEGLYRDAVALLDLLQIDACHWVGASIGGMVGMRLAARHPDRVRSLVLIGPSLRPTSRASLRRLEAMGLVVRLSGSLGPVGARLRARVTDQVMTTMFGSTLMSDPARADERDRWRQRFSEQLVPEAMPMLREGFGYPETPPELLAKIEAPTLILVGDEEPGGADEAQAAQRAIPNAELLTIPGAGHMVLVEQPRVGGDAIAAFIQAAQLR